MKFSYTTIFSSFLLRLSHNLVDIGAIVQLTQLIRTEECYVHTTIPAHDSDTQFTTTDTFPNTVRLANAWNTAGQNWFDLIHPTSTWTYWATLRRHSCLLRAATSASSQVSPIPRRSFLTKLSSLSLADRVPSWNLGPPSIMRRWSIRIVWPSQRSLLPLRVFRMLCCPVLALTYSFLLRPL